MVAPRALPQRRNFTEDPQVARVDQAREDLTRVLSACPFLRGRLISVTFSGGVRKLVRHGLGVAAACIVIRQDYNTAGGGPFYGSLLEYQNNGVDLTQNLGLIHDVSCVLDLWFYPRASKTINAGQGQSL